MDNNSGTLQHLMPISSLSLSSPSLSSPSLSSPSLSSPSSSVSISDYDSCKICFNSLSMPLQLNCGHTVCVDCTKKLIISQHDCPFCRKAIVFASINYALSELINCKATEDDNSIYRNIDTVLQEKHGDIGQRLKGLYTVNERSFYNWYRDNQYEPWMSGFVYITVFKYVYRQRNNLDQSHYLQKQLQRCINQPPSACQKFLEQWDKEPLSPYFTNDIVFELLYEEIKSFNENIYSQQVIDHMDFSFLKWLSRKYAMSKRSRDEVAKSMINKPIKREDVFPSCA
jgi:hypothetical protein